MTARLGESIHKRFSQAAVDAMRAAIDQAGGSEVFFSGKLDALGLVESVRVWARGNAEAVPAFLEGLGLRDVVIHNHPSGEIAPSDADLRVAGMCANNGHGVYIVDGEVSRVYVVVEPFLDKDIHFLHPADLKKIFSPGQKMAQLMPQFEVRPQQLQMMDTVSRAFNENKVAAVEAPTGIGKTFAYLVPAVTWAVKNRERVVISTRTINLQEQIIFKDIPILQDSLGEKFNAVLVKGRNNYICLRKFKRIVSELALDEVQQVVIEKLAQWLEHTEDGSRSDLPFVPPRDVWDQIASEADTCAGGRCPEAAKCFVTKARRELAKAHFIIANHHVLFSDIALKWEVDDFNSPGVLPVYKRLILDEAHSIEDSATEYFGVEATRNGAVNLFGRFHRKERVHERGLLPFIKIKLIKEIVTPFQQVEQALAEIDNHVLPALAAARESVIAAFEVIRSIAGEKCGQIGRDVKWRLTEERLADQDLRQAYKVYVLPAVDELQALGGHCRALIDLLTKIQPKYDEPESPLLPEIYELTAYMGRLERLAAVLKESFSEEIAENTVRWIEIDSAKPTVVRVTRCPIDVGDRLAESVYENMKTVVLTSATLTVQQQFNYFFKRTGLDNVPEGRMEREVLGTPFNFETQAMLCIARDLPSPDQKGFLDETVDAVRSILKITRGHALVLFTSFYALDYVHTRLQKELNAAGLAALKQGVQTRTQTLDRFRNDISSVLFATDSFWEGIDVAGAALQCVILPRLPFRVPTEPIQQARAETIDSSGGNSFIDYTVPQAVIRFRQGFGRLIRRKSDRGTIVVLDKRVAGKYYGRAFLQSLPGVPVFSGPRRAMYGALEKFYLQEGLK